MQKGAGRAESQSTRTHAHPRARARARTRTHAHPRTARTRKHIKLCPRYYGVGELADLSEITASMAEVRTLASPTMHMRIQPMIPNAGQTEQFQPQYQDANAPSPVITAPAGNINASASANTTVTVTANGTTCPEGPCAYAWSLSCPSPAQVSPTTYTSVTWAITVGPGGIIDTTNTTEPFNCTLGLTVTDAANRTATATTTLTIE